MRKNANGIINAICKMKQCICAYRHISCLFGRNLFAQPRRLFSRVSFPGKIFRLLKWRRFCGRRSFLLPAYPYQKFLRLSYGDDGKCGHVG